MNGFGGVLISFFNVASRMRSVSSALRSSPTSSFFGVFAMSKRYRVVGSKSGFELYASGGPIDQPRKASRLFAKLGRAAAAWARMEMMLDAFIIRVNKPSENVHLYDDEHPVSFKRKMRLATKWLSHPAIIEHADLFRGAFSIIRDMAGLRNELTHSDVRSYDSTSGDFVLANMRSAGAGIFRLSEHTYNIADVDEMTHKCTRAALALSELLDLLPPAETASQQDQSAKAQARPRARKSLSRKPSKI